MGLLPFLRALAQVDVPPSAAGKSAVDAFPAVLDFLHLDPFLLLRSPAHSGLAMSAFGKVQVESPLFAVLYGHFGVLPLLHGSA